MDTPLMPIPSSWPKAEALFRAQIIAPLLDPLSSREERQQWRRWVTGRPHTLPNGETRTISERTLRRWVAQYRDVGLNALERRPRPDKGYLRKVTPDILDRAKALKQEDPRRSVPHILRILETEREEAIDITPGALWRHLVKVGLGGRGAAPPEGLRRWEAQAPNQLWQSDVKHGPYLPDPLRPGKMQKTYLIGFIDDFSRCIMHAEWYWAEDIYALELCFQKSLLRKGKPMRVYVDRGLIYQSHVFRSACAELGVRHVSATAYHAAGKGKIERFWRNVDQEFLIELENHPVDTLEAMNRQFWAWLEEVYHRRIHSETGMTPLARFATARVAPLSHPERLAELFLWRTIRVVDKTGCISFLGNKYQLEPGLEKRRIEVRYHPLHLERLQVWTGDKRWPDATPLDLQQTRVKSVNPRHDLPTEKTPALYLEALVRQHERRKQNLISPLQFSQESDPEGGEGVHV